MRTSVTLDDDMYELASTYAAARKITLDAAVSELLRSANAPATEERYPNIKISPQGIPILSSRVGPITMERVKAAQEDEIG